MAAVTACVDAPGSDRWLAARGLGIGASEIAALLGMDPYRTAVDLYLEKTGQAEGFTGNYPSRRGQHMESFVLAEYARQHPGTIIETAPDDIPSILCHADVPEARCSLDALAHDRDETIAVEVKTCGHRQRGKWADGAVPDGYALQVMYQLAITGLQKAVIVADVAGDYEERIILRDDAMCERMIATVQQWWHDHIVAGVEPTPDPVRDRDRLADLWPADDRLPAVVVSDDLAQRLRDAKAAAAAAKTDLEVVTAEIQIAMQRATAAVTPDGEPVAKWTASKGRESIDTTALKAALPDVAAQYTRTGKPGRRFTVSN